MRKLLSLCTLVVLTCGLLLGQSDQPATSTDTGRDKPDATRVVTPRHENNWGWIGLLGLAGLAGLRRKPSVNREYNSGNVRRVA